LAPHRPSPVAADLQWPRRAALWVNPTLVLLEGVRSALEQQRTKQFDVPACVQLQAIEGKKTIRCRNPLRKIDNLHLERQRIGKFCNARGKLATAQCRIEPRATRVNPAWHGYGVRAGGTASPASENRSFPVDSSPRSSTESVRTIRRVFNDSSPRRRMGGLGDLATRLRGEVPGSCEKSCASSIRGRFWPPYGLPQPASSRFWRKLRFEPGYALSRPSARPQPLSPPVLRRKTELLVPETALRTLLGNLPLAAS